MHDSPHWLAPPYRGSFPALISCTHAPNFVNKTAWWGVLSTDTYSTAIAAGLNNKMGVKLKLFALAFLGVVFAVVYPTAKKNYEKHVKPHVHLVANIYTTAKEFNILGYHIPWRYILPVIALFIAYKLYKVRKFVKFMHVLKVFVSECQFVCFFFLRDFIIQTFFEVLKQVWDNTKVSQML